VLPSQARRRGTARRVLRLKAMKNTPPPDIELTEAYLRLKEQLRAHLRRRGLDASVAADVVQDVFTKALTHQQAGKSISNITGWLFSAVRNAAIDHHRANRPTAPLVEDVAEEPAEDLQAHAAMAECLRPLTARLPKIYRDTVQAVDLEQMLIRDVAQREGVSLSAIKTRASRGRQMLKEALLQCCQVEFGGGLVEAAIPVGACACETAPPLSPTLD